MPVAVQDENLLGLLSPLQDFTSQNIDETITAAMEYRIGDQSFLHAARDVRTAIAFDSASAACRAVVELISKALAQAGAKKTLLLEIAPDATKPRSPVAALEKPLEVTLSTARHEPRTSPALKVGEVEGGGEVLMNEALASADIRCVVGNVALSPFWGYTGGPSIVIPGLASEGTIRACISPTLRATRAPGLLSGNATYEALLRVSQMVRIDLAVHVVEWQDERVAGVFVGDFLETFQRACALAGRIFRPSLRRRADIVISSAGGYSWDRTLFDASISAMMAATACKDHGTMILVAECADGVGNFASAESGQRDYKKVTAGARRWFTLEKLVEYSFRKICEEHRMYLVSTLPEHHASSYGLLAARSIGSALQRAFRHVEKDALVAVIPQGSVTAPLVG